MLSLILPRPRLVIQAIPEILQAFLLLNCKMKVKVGPSPDSAGVVVDGLRQVGVGPRYRRRARRTLSYFMKQPPQFADDEARSHRSVRQHDEQRVYALAVNLRRQSVNIQ